MIELKKYKKNFINAFFALVTYLSILIYLKVIFSNNTFNFLFTCLYILIYYFYNKEVDVYYSCDNRTKWFVNIFSVFISIVLILGSIVSSYLGDIFAIILSLKNIVYIIIGTIGFYFLFRIFIAKILKNLIYINDTDKRKMTKKIFFLVMLLMIICWFPYFLRFFPGIMTNDSYYSIHYVNNGILSDYHTFGHTWFFGTFFLIGKVLFSKLNYAVAFYIIIQMFINSFIFALIIKFLYEKGIRKIYILLVLAFMCFSPLYALYSITLWRDILFGLAFVLLFISLYKFVDNNYKLDFNNCLMYIISIIMILFFRNNGIYVLLLFVPILILFTKKNRKIVALFNIIVIVLYFIIKGPIFDYFQVQKTTSTEAYSIPLQQIARVVSNDADINDADYKKLDKFIDVDRIKEEYDSVISDPVKRLVNNEYLTNNKGEFFKLWFNLLIDNPRIYFEAYFCQTLGYWYPDVIYWATAGESESIFDDDVYSEPIFKEQLSLLDHLTSRKIPLSNFVWSLGLMFILFVFSAFLLIYKKKYKYLLPYFPLLCLWLSLMVATPVFSELRYIYGLFVCLPLFIFVPFIKTKK